ncbi:MAG: FAD binding domain-containing protein [Terriglobia bacterium]
MIPSAFDYLAPKTLEEAVGLLERHGADAKLLAGGHSLLPLMKLRLAAPRILIDLGRVRELSYIRAAGAPRGQKIAIGAMTTHTAIETSELLRQRAPLLAETAAEIADVQVRNRGTLGGSLAHADPAADYPAALLVLDAEFKAVSRTGERVIPASEFFLEMLTTALQPGEILAEVRFAVDPPGTGSTYKKLHQPASGFAIVGVAARVVLDGRGHCSEVRVGVTGMAAKPYRAANVESELWDKKLDAKTIARAAARAAEGVEPLSDLHASARYRAAMAEVFTRRALSEAFTRAQKA